GPAPSSEPPAPGATPPLESKGKAEPETQPVAQPQPWAAPVDDDQREEDIVPMSPMRRRIAQRLVQAQQDAALLTTFNEADMSAIIGLRHGLQEAFQERYKIKLGFMSFFVKATIDALKQVPALNARI